MKQVSEEIREFDEWLGRKYAERKDKGNVLPVGMTDAEFVEWAIRILLGDGWYTAAPVSQNQVNEIAMEDIVFRECGMEAKDRKRETTAREDFSESGLEHAGELTQDEYAGIVQSKSKGAE